MKPSPISTAHWPQTARMAEWSRIVELSPITLRSYVKAGRLKVRKKLNGSVIITKEDICKCLGLK